MIIGIEMSFEIFFVGSLHSAKFTIRAVSDFGFGSPIPEMTIKRSAHRTQTFSGIPESGTFSTIIQGPDFLDIIRGIGGS